MPIKKNIPNTITLGNLLCGCLAIIKTFHHELDWAAYFVGIALILDFFDGFSARMLKVSSPIGKDLDSLADLVTFGVVPGMIMFQMINLALWKTASGGVTIQGWMTDFPKDSVSFYLPYSALIIPLFSCIRLAKFNNDTRQSDSFIGLNTPSNAMVICSLPLIMNFQPQFHFVADAAGNAWFLVIFSVVMSLMLVSEIPFFALKFKNFGWADNKLRFVFLGLSLILLLSLQFLAIPVIILLYIVLSVMNNFLLKEKKAY